MHAAIFEKFFSECMLLRLFGALIGASGDVPTSSAVGGTLLFVAARPLIGGPTFFPVHCALRCEAADSDPKAFVLDIVPVAPRDPATALTLATGGDVAAEIRVRKSPGRPGLSASSGRSTQLCRDVPGCPQTKNRKSETKNIRLSRSKTWKNPCGCS